MFTPTGATVPVPITVAGPLTIKNMQSLDDQTQANQISVGILDMWLYLYVENYEDVADKVHEYKFLNYHGILKTCQQNVNSDSPLFSFPKERRYNFICCAFIQQQATIKNTYVDLGGIRFDQVQSVIFSSTPTASTNSIGTTIDQTGEIVNYGTTPFLQEGYIKSKLNVTNPIINLKSISLLINGITFPSENYNFNFTVNTSAANAGATTLNIYDDPPNDIYRAYQEYVNCYYSDNGCGKFLTFSEWFVNPIFCFKIEGTLPNSLDNNVYINLLYRTGSVQNVYMYASAYFIDTLRLKFDGNAQFVRVEDKNTYGI